MGKEALENKSNSLCVFIYLLYYNPYKTATAILLLCCNEDALDFVLTVASAQNDLKFIDLFV